MPNTRLRDLADQAIRRIRRDNQVPELWPSVIARLSDGTLSGDEQHRIEAIVRSRLLGTRADEDPEATFGLSQAGTQSRGTDRAGGGTRQSVAGARTVVRTIEEDPSLIAYQDIDRMP